MSLTLGAGCCRQTYRCRPSSFMLRGGEEGAEKEEEVTLAQAIEVKRIHHHHHHHHQKWLCYHRRGCCCRRRHCRGRSRTTNTAEWTTPQPAPDWTIFSLFLLSLALPHSPPLSLLAFLCFRSSRLPEIHTWFPGCQNHVPDRPSLLLAPATAAAAAGIFECV